MGAVALVGVPGLRLILPAGTTNGAPHQALAEGSPPPVPITGSYGCQVGATGGFQTCQLVDSNGRTMTFFLQVPEGYSAKKHYPVVLLLHGGGERAQPRDSVSANDQRLLSIPYVRVWGTDYHGRFNPDIQQQWPSIVVVPLIPYPQRWTYPMPQHGSFQQASQPTEQLRMAMDILEQVQQKYPAIDPTRRYIVGLSIGGYGTWDAIERWPDYFAAAAPCAGAGDPSKAASIKDMPIWVSNGSADPIVPPAGSQDMVAALRAAGGHPHDSVFQGGHVAGWEYLLGVSSKQTEPTSFFKWLFAQRLDRSSEAATPS